MTCKAYCPRCGDDLVSSPGTTFTDTDLVRYNCGSCGTRSEWLFDAPAPLLIAPRLERLANRESSAGRMVWDAVAKAVRAVRSWPHWKRGHS